MDFIIQADHRVKMKESKKIDKQLELTRGENVECDGDTNCS